MSGQRGCTGEPPRCNFHPLDHGFPSRGGYGTHVTRMGSRTLQTWLELTEPRLSSWSLSPLRLCVCSPENPDCVTAASLGWEPDTDRNNRPRESWTSAFPSRGRLEGRLSPGRAGPLSGHTAFSYRAGGNGVGEWTGQGLANLQVQLRG